jgi:hypothetical protein
MHIGVEALEKCAPSLCLAMLSRLYRLGEAVGVCHALTASVGFIEEQVGCAVLRDTGHGRLATASSRQRAEFAIGRARGDRSRKTTSDRGVRRPLSMREP